MHKGACLKCGFYAPSSKTRILILSPRMESGICIFKTHKKILEEIGPILKNLKVTPTFCFRLGGGVKSF